MTLQTTHIGRVWPKTELFRAVRWISGAVVLTVLMPQPARAQQTDAWEVSVAPFYLWAANVGGTMDVKSVTVPVSMDFADAAKHLAAAFSIHVEARKARLGVFTDLDYSKLSTSSQFTTPGVVTGTQRTVDGSLDFAQTIFEIGGSYLVNSPKKFSVIGGLRTYTLAPKITFTDANTTLTPVDASRTSANAFGGFTFRPQLATKWRLVSRADIGAGNAKLTWSALLGLEFGFKPWGALALGYKALGINTGSGSADQAVTDWDVTYYGPIMGLNLHWGAK
jgi:hypothetical protein